MYKTDASGNVAGQYTNGVPGVTPATIVDATHLNAIQNELVNLVQGAGLVLDKTNSAQVLAAIQTMIGHGYKRDVAPANGYTTPAAFLAGTFVSLGVCPSSAGEVCEFLSQAGAGPSNSMLYSMVVNSVAGCTCNVVVAQTGNAHCYLAVDGTIVNSWTQGQTTTPYAMVLGAGSHVIQFLLNNNSGSAAPTYINDWMTGNSVTFTRAAHS